MQHDRVRRYLSRCEAAWPERSEVTFKAAGVHYFVWKRANHALIVKTTRRTVTMFLFVNRRALFGVSSPKHKLAWMEELLPARAA